MLTTLALVTTLGFKWQCLVTQARRVDTTLVATKIKFANTTTTQVSNLNSSLTLLCLVVPGPFGTTHPPSRQVVEFLKEAAAFRLNFEESGPGGSGLDLDDGLKILETFKAKLGMRLWYLRYLIRIVFLLSEVDLIFK